MEINPVFDKIFLTERDVSLLEDSKNGEVIYSKSADYLLEMGLMEHYRLTENKNAFVITPIGLRYVKYLNDLKQKEKNKQKIISIRYWITNAISILALIVSIIALIKK